MTDFPCSIPKLRAVASATGFVSGLTITSSNGIFGTGEK